MISPAIRAGLPVNVEPEVIVENWANGRPAVPNTGNRRNKVKPPKEVQLSPKRQTITPKGRVVVHREKVAKVPPLPAKGPGRPTKEEAIERERIIEERRTLFRHWIRTNYAVPDPDKGDMARHLGFNSVPEMHVPGILQVSRDIYDANYAGHYASGVAAAAAEIGEAVMDEIVNRRNTPLMVLAAKARLGMVEETRVEVSRGVDVSERARAAVGKLTEIVEGEDDD